MKRKIDLSYPIHSGKEAARTPQPPSRAKPVEAPEGPHSVEITVITILTNNVHQYWLQGSMEVPLKMGKRIVLNKGVYMDKELNALIGLELKSQMDECDGNLRTNKLENVTKMVISLDELDNSDSLEDGRPSNALFMYYVTSPEYSTHFEPATPQYKKCRHGTITSLTLKITDQNNNIISDGPGTTVVLHIH